jgi:DNA (cytosine-5)-methyltransferase 1
MPAYYNEIDPFAAQWLRNLIAAGLIAAGEVDERSIVDVQPDDLAGFTQCHFFAGIGGWSYALRLAGWADDRPVWTGSCPCQHISTAARGRNNADDLWPEWRRLITARSPVVLFGEQVPQFQWCARAAFDLEALGLSFGAAVLPAYGIGQDHARPRFYFAAHADDQGQPGRNNDAEMAVVRRDGNQPGSVAPADGVPGRMDFYRAYGNAIVPQVAAEFIAAYLECRP